VVVVNFYGVVAGLRRHLSCLERCSLTAPCEIAPVRGALAWPRALLRSYDNQGSEPLVDLTVTPGGRVHGIEKKIAGRSKSSSDASCGNSLKCRR
jgi:hypothetical protein